ncbi:Endoribonuclease L-PSP/chorismate mutase-like protein [Trichoderma evansii]
MIPSVSFFNHQTGEKMSETFGYSQVAKLSNGAVVLAGMLGVDATMALAPTLEQQVEIILDHIEAALETASAKPTDVFKVISYHLDIEESMSLITAAWLRRNGFKPTWTAVGVTQLGFPGARLEVQVEAWPNS